MTPTNNQALIGNMLQLKFLLKMPAGFYLPAEGERKKALQRSIATELEQTVREHFFARPGKKYWQEAADATLANPDVPGEVNVRHRGVALHLFGGTVQPGKGQSYSSGKPTRLLAIPTEKAYGRTPSFYGPGGLVFVPVKKGWPHLRGLLVGARPQKGKGKKSAAEPPVLFRLVDSATIRPDRTVLPPDKAIGAAMLRGLEAYLYHECKNNGSR